MNPIRRMHLESLLSGVFVETVPVEAIIPVGGGCINETAKIQTSRGAFFAKWNVADGFPGMLEAEAKGLQVLKEAGEIAIPAVISQKTIEKTQYLLLGFVGPSARGMDNEKFWSIFGKSLARLHRHTSERFGLDHDNYIGSLPQSNRRHRTWAEFFIMERLEPQIRRAVDTKQLSSSIVSRFNKLFSKLESIFPPERPALLHGDLWSGNYMAGSHGEPVLIDPSVYFGHREMDLAMTRLFGGFETGFYDSYQEEFPLENDWRKRTDICNLYPLLVHVNLFGGGYALQVEGILKRF